MWNAKEARIKRRNRKKAARLARKYALLTYEQWEDVYSTDANKVGNAITAAEQFANAAIEHSNAVGTAEPRRRGRANKAARYAMIASMEAYAMSK